MRNSSHVTVVGQVGVDLVLEAPRLGAEHVTVDRRTTALGGKGANQAVGLARADVPVALVGVVGDDPAGRAAIAQAEADGIDCRGVVRRTEAQTALFVDATDDRGHRVVFEHVPAGVLLTTEDVDAASDVLDAAGVVVLQGQQPRDALVRARRLAPGALVVLDGAAGDAVLGEADVLRADADEAEQLLGHGVTSLEEGLEAARSLARRGPRVVALEVKGSGDVLHGPRAEVALPHRSTDVADPTGGGDAFVAGLVAALWHGRALDEAAAQAHEAAARVVAHAGGRPRDE